ncbi:MAG: uridine diphosphate-N-acetylglucosamine-binding protein YvcK [Coriobacteriia bacterium]|nr:uridine diphosphate-N-acetylglucosamine-binding protein YvcK [Coriobacteriia bacterium]
MSARRAVAIGGGTGLPLVLRCLLEAGFDPTAVVTVADDGGSSGELRRELGVLPPGDIRNCLVALAEPGSALASLFQYRFSQGSGLAGHALGNLAIAALADIEGGFAEGVEAAARLLGARGKVLPSTLVDVRLSGRDAAGTVITGQANVARTDGPIAAVCMDPEAPPAYGPALDTIGQADVVVIGPGSLFTSIIPDFLVGGMTEAVRATRATVIYVCNVANMRGETNGMDAADHVDALVRHGLDGVIDVALVDTSHLPDEHPHVAAGPDVVARIEAYGIRVHAALLADPVTPTHHDPARLLAALGEVW